MPGAERLRDCAPLMAMMHCQADAGKLHAAICATPAVALEPSGCGLGSATGTAASAAAVTGAAVAPAHALQTCLPTRPRTLTRPPTRRSMLKGKRATAHPAFSDRLANQAAVAQRVVVDGMLVTSRGPGTAFEFALALVAQLYGEGKAREVAAPMVMPDGWDGCLKQ